jgi:23S rRNA (cytosine1962-C5)-methyltransferase
MNTTIELLHNKLEKAFRQRSGLLNSEFTNVIRLFNGFLEGEPRWVIELFGETLVINDNLNIPSDDLQIVRDLSLLYSDWIPALKSVLYKHRYAKDPQLKKGVLIRGERLNNKIRELGIHYFIDLQINQDSSFYLDTRYLRAWLLQHMNGKSVLNTFAYTGSLGVAALAGGASKVVQVDLNRKFLEISHQSCALNGFSTHSMKLIAGDFYRVIGNYRHSGKLFDCVIIDPPHFSTTTAGRVDLVNESTRLINKVRPLVAHNGYLIIVNNALFLSGERFMQELEELCQGPYLEIDRIIPVPQDVIGYPETIVAQLPVEIQPFNHSTKIVILSVQRKDERGSNA